jgi:DNA repair protein RecN (Recombination protein N)
MCKKNIQRDMLDHFGDLKDLTNKTKKAYVNYKEQSEKLNRIIESNADKVDRIDLLEFQEKELESLNLSHNKYNDLNKEFKKISNTEEISKGVNTLIGNLQTNEITNAGLIISDSMKNLNSLINFDDKFKEVKEMMIDAEINISEAVDVLSKYISSIDFDSDRSSFLEEKINAIHAISRKHKVEPNNLIKTHEEIKNELDYLRDSEASIIKIEEKINEYKKLYDERAKELTNGRIKASKKLSKLVSEAMAELGMTGGVFDIEIKSIEGHSKHGNEEINFLISANPGQKPKPLTKIASGGELSRMSLAIQVIASNGSNIPTMIFDEVDSGIGGAIAEMVGIRLSDLSNQRQILCVTHLAQVASKGDSHIRINKLSDQNTTKIHATKLNEDSRIEEIARMLGGIELTDKTRDHAIEMLSKKN